MINYDWRVSISKPLLRRMSRLLKPVFSANHRWAMDRGQQSLRLELRRGRALLPGRGTASVPPTFGWLLHRRLDASPTAHTW